MKFVIAALLAVSATSAHASTPYKKASALAELVFHAEYCGITLQKQAIIEYVANSFEDTAKAMSTFSISYGAAGYDAKRMSENRRMVTCVLIKQFAEKNGII